MRIITTLAACLAMTIVVMVTAVGSHGAAAQGMPGPGVGPHYVDANGDGICDHFQAGGYGGRRASGAPDTPCAWCGFGANGGSLVDVAAAVAGRQRSDVLADLRAGRTFTQIVEASGRNSQDLVTAVLANRKEAFDRAVSDGHLTTQQAEELLARIKAHVEHTIAATSQPGGGGVGGPCHWGGGGHGAGHGGRWR
jgi:hypothetical protein